jgi:hypothetical protein
VLSEAGGCVVASPVSVVSNAEPASSTPGTFLVLVKGKA